MSGAQTDHAHHHQGFLSRYVFSLDHKMIGKQFLISSFLFLAIGGLLALGVRWQLAWPWQEMPVVGKMLFSGEGGQISPEFYTMLFTMHASIMIFFVVIPLLTGTFGNFCIPLMIGARDMAFPLLNMLSYWAMWPGFLCMVASFFVAGGAAAGGWTSYPPLSAVTSASPGSHMGQTLWLIGLLFVGISSLMGSINYITTIIKMRAPGMTMFRMPLTVWSLFITAILQAFALPVLTAALIMQLLDRVGGTTFFIPFMTSLSGATTDVGVIVNNVGTQGGGQALLWQHLFWFYSHPAVYIMILPAMGMVSDILATFARKPIFGYKPMVYAIAGIAGLGFVVWAHHMFMSGMNPALGLTFMTSTMFIALPSAVKTFNWLGTIWRSKIQYTTAMLFALSFVAMFIIGGLSGIFMAATPVDIHIHDTYFIVAHIHYVLMASSLMAVFGAIYYWFPKMFGRFMNEGWGKVHFVISFIAINCTFFPMHLLGVAGMPRRYADPYHFESFRDLLSLNQFITVSALVLGAAQIIFVLNFFLSLWKGREVTEKNPWQSNTLEWTTPIHPGHGNWEGPLPTVYRGPYEFSSPEVKEDFLPQDRKLEASRR